MKSYLIGNAVRSSVRFRDPSRRAVDPGEVIIKVKWPDGTVVVYTYGVDLSVVRESEGVYHFDVGLDAPGEWHCRWEGTGDNMAAAEHAFECTPSTF